MSDDALLGSLPPEYREQLQQMLRQRQMATMMQQMAMQQQPTQFTGGKYSNVVRMNPLQGLVQGMMGYMGGQRMEEADKGVSDVYNRYEGATQEGLKRLIAPGASLPEGMTSNLPRVAAMAAELYKQKQARTAEGAKIVGANDPGAGIKILQDNELPMGYQAPKLGEPTFGTDPSANPYAITTNTKGEKHLQYAPKASTVSIGIPGKEAENMLEMTKGEIKERAAKADSAKETLSSTRAALEAINEGAKSGGLEGYKLAVKKGLQGFGIDTSNLTSTEELNMAMGQQILAKARALAPVTQADVEQLKSILGSVNTDPQALQKMLAITSGVAAKELQDFNRFTDQGSSDMREPLAQALYRNSAIGREMQAPPGNTGQALRAIQELQKRGGNVSSFAVGGEQIPQDAQFNIRGAPPSGVTAQKPIGQMSPQEMQAEIDDLKRRLGITGK